jgi:hypothetical protein
VKLPTFIQLRGFATFIVLQGLNKGLGVIQGLLVINLLSKWDYGLYALLLAVVTATANIGICGVGMFISSVGGRHVQDPARMASVYAAGRRVQAFLIGASLLIVMVALPWQYHSMEIENPLLIACLTTLGLLMMMLNARGTLCRELLSISLQLHRNQAVDMGANVVRISLILLAVWGGMFDVVTLLALSLLVSATALTVQDHLVTRHVLQGRGLELREEELREAKRVIFPQLPNAAYNSVQAQIPYLLMSWMGTVQHVAEFAALGRLAFLFSFFVDVLVEFFMPRIGRCQDPGRLGRLILVVLMGFYATVGTGLLTALVFKSEILWLLGSQYANLEQDIPLMLLLIGVSSVAGSLFSINSARAWMGHSWIFIISTVSAQALSIPLLDLSTIRGMLWFSIVPQIPFIVINLIFILRGLRRAHRDL